MNYKIGDLVYSYYRYSKSTVGMIVDICIVDGSVITATIDWYTTEGIKTHRAPKSQVVAYREAYLERYEK